MPNKQQIPLPQQFVHNMRQLLGNDEAQRLINAINQDEIPVSIRLNKRKGQALSQILANEKIPHCPQGFYLPHRPSFTADPLFHAGVYYVQEASSMVLALIEDLLPQRPLTVLDLCASPGGKSTLLTDILPQDSVLISNEVIPNRANILKENIQKWGYPHSIVTNSYPDKWHKIGAVFDVILIDAPCSGEGMFRKDQNARTEWNPSSPTECSKRQKNILDKIFHTLKNDGLIIYSTCTYNKQENEDIAHYISNNLGAVSIPLTKTPQNTIYNRFSQLHTYRFMPHVNKGEGLFFCVMRKSIQDNNITPPKKQNFKITTPTKEHLRICQQLLPSAELFHQDENNTLWGMSKNTAQIFSLLIKNGIKVLSKGIELATIKGKSLSPSTALALSTSYESTSSPYHCVEVDKVTALQYLQGQSITLCDAPKQILTITYKNYPLGFVKNLGNRANNLYPSYWRIQKTLSQLTSENTLSDIIT